MGVIKSTIVLEKALRTEFVKSFANGETPADVAPMIMETKSTSNKEKYGWLGQAPQMIEWKDSRTLKGLLDYDYEIKNVSYESTLQVDRDEVDDDQIGNIKIRIQDMARVARNHPRKLFFELVNAGEIGLCYDGSPFFSTTHKYTADAVAQSNLYSGTKAGALPTVAEFIADFEKVRAGIEKLKFDNGEPANEGELDLFIWASPDMKSVMDKAFKADQLDSATNVIKGAAKYGTTSRISGADWYVFVTNTNVKPIVKQMRQPAKFEAMEKGEQAFMNKLLKYGIDYRIGFGYGLWEKAAKLKY
jgi:phage major head subunit gpT-like protein